MKLWHGAFSAQMSAVNHNSSGAEVQVLQRGSLRTMNFMKNDHAQLLGDMTTMNCGELDPRKPQSCHAQPCKPVMKPEELGLYENDKELVSVGPSVLGSALKKVALIGVAGGVEVHFLHALLPDMMIDAVEFSPSVAEAALSCFALPTSENVKLHVQDGMSFLQTKHDLAYDWIIIDASGSQNRFGTLEAHRLFSRLVGPKGLVTFNTAGFPVKHMVKAKAIARKVWKYAYATPNDFAWTFSNQDISSATQDNMLSQGEMQNAWQVAVAKWFGEGLSPLPQWPTA